MRDIGKNIRELRIKKNMTQDALAESLFVSRQTVSNYETGKSRPDVDMLVKMAEVLDTDVNSLLYGIPNSENHKKELRAFLHGVFACAVTGLPFIFWDKAAELSRRAVPGPRIILQFIVLPIFLLILAWAFMQDISLVTKAKRPIAKWGKYIYWSLLLILAVYFILLLPQTMHIVKSYTVHQYMDSLSPPLGLRGSFSYSIDCLNMLMGHVGLFFGSKQYLFFAVGVLLWIFELRGSGQVKALLIYSTLALALSATLYLTADEEFILEVENPDTLLEVPRKVRVVQYPGDDMDE